jgi:hypothetical protein
MGSGDPIHLSRDRGNFYANSSPTDVVEYYGLFRTFLPHLMAASAWFQHWPFHGNGGHVTEMTIQPHLNFENPTS